MSKEYQKQWYANMPPEKKAAFIKKKSMANKERFKTSPEALARKKDYEKSDSGIYARYKNDCNRRSRLKRGIKMELSLEQFSTVINSPCVFCNVVSRGADRIDSSKSYTLENTQACCSDCNEMKNDKTNDQFIEHIKKILVNRGI